MMAEAAGAVEGIPAFPLAALSLPCLNSAVFTTKPLSIATGIQIRKCRPKAAPHLSRRNN
jgi:hypothetical protein